MGTKRIVVDLFEDQLASGVDPVSDALWLRARLTDQDIELQRDSILARGLDLLERLFRGQLTRAPSPDALELALGTQFLAEQLRHLHATAPDALDEVWPLLRGSDVLLVGCRAQSQRRDRMFEAIRGSIGAAISTATQLRGHENPDVFLKYLDRGVGIECVLIYGTARRDQVRKRVKQKVRQLLGNAEVDHGWVAIDLTPAFRPRETPTTDKEAMGLLHEHVHGVADALLSDTRLRRKMLRNSPKLLGLLFFARCIYMGPDGLGIAHLTHNVTTVNEALQAGDNGGSSRMAQPRRPNRSRTSSASSSFANELLAAQRQTLIDLVRDKSSLTLAELVGGGVPGVGNITVGEIVSGKTAIRTRGGTRSKAAASPSGSKARKSKVKTWDLRTEEDRNRYDEATMAALKKLGGEASAGAIRAAVGGTPAQFRGSMERWMAEKAIAKSGVKRATQYRIK